MEPKFPNFIIGGAPKCGTSSLYFWLSAHPEVYGSPKKETFFWSDKINRFNQEANCHEHDLQAYASFFKGARSEAIRFEATAHYLYERRALAHFSAATAPPKVLFLFREPSAMMYSHYKMERYRTKRVDLPLEDYVRLPKMERNVNYAHYVQPWMEALPPDHVRFYAFEDIMARKQDFMQELAQWLGISPSFYATYNFEHRNESVAIKSGFLHQLGLRLQPLVPHALQKLLLPLYLKLNSGGRVQDDASHAAVLAEVKARWAHVGDALHELDPKFPNRLWQK